ncbi:unnamed protein product [Kuraishia capsulata CBS 1993]|uniref:non-reducing end alpha-L-arabinofuranosidase n=1 Tax=Kuraishia capsulata CBS 1993 TaxID=1382522 RepID=W6MR74_9ASCO|nr:uncharacterized protein KUCA_T00005214001 [Kuraishia capsulata CBS 1993]CDK29226.1 unnamed protein product [Kuraishia capsulata CBS 1993]
MSTTAQSIKKLDTFVGSEIKIDKEFVTGEVAPNIFAGFLEHLGRCIYGGIVDYGNTKLTNDKGFRTDVAEAIKELDMPVMRWPGGNFVSSYHWLDGVGPVDQRPKRPELAWLNTESNEFGTDEFMQWCEYMGTEPYLCLNMGTGTLDEALAWVEYCNGDKDTYYANLRRKNGREKPYNVKYWGVGNEVWGPWQVGQMTKENYALKAAQWAKAIKLLDPTVKLVACGCNGVDEWDQHVVGETFTTHDFYSIHLYTTSQDHYKNVFQPAGAETAIQVTSKLAELAKITNMTNKKFLVPLTEEQKKKEYKIVFDEWNVWDPIRADGEHGAEQQYDFSDGLAVASWLNVFIRQAKYLEMTNIAQCVNVIAPIMTNKDGLFKQTTYYPFQLFSKYFKNGQSLNLSVKSPIYKGDVGDFIGLEWVKYVDTSLALLDVSAVYQPAEKAYYVAVVNRSEDEDAETKISIADAADSLNVTEWAYYHENIRAINTFEKPNEVVPKESKVTISNNSTYKFPKHSFTLLKIQE